MTPQPTEIDLDRAARLLRVTFDDGLHAALPAEYLRIESPSAEVQGHSPAQRRLVRGKADVAITALHPVGHYAVQLVFSDGHDTGLYSWDVLYRLARGMDGWRERYAAALRQAGPASPA